LQSKIQSLAAEKPHSCKESIWNVYFTPPATSAQRFSRTLTAFRYHGEIYHDDFHVPLFLGLVIGLLLTSCISCLVLYGFGEAIENMHAIKWKIENHDFTDEKERFERVKNALSK
jgi:hypothetical protein